MSEAETGSSPLTFLISFEGVGGRSQLEVARALAMAERYALQDPRTLARYRIDLSTGELDHVDVPEAMDAIPAEFLDARESLFDAICRNQWPLEGKESPTLVALCNLRVVEREVNAYLQTWRRALETAPSPAAVDALLGLDQVTFVRRPVGWWCPHRTNAPTSHRLAREIRADSPRVVNRASAGSGRGARSPTDLGDACQRRICRT